MYKTQGDYSTKDDKRGIERCESPLEVKLAHAFSELAGFQWREPDHESWEVGRWPGWYLVLLAQAEFEPYRFDFVILTWAYGEDELFPFVVIVEVDGHDYHERTKEQAEYDKARDRFMTARTLTNVKIFRFTGREVWRDAEACAHEVLEYVIGIQNTHLNKEFLKFLEKEHPREKTIGGEQQ